MRWSFPASGIPSVENANTACAMMTDAILLCVREIQNVHGRGPIDALAVSLSSEFLARAVTETPLTFRTLALVSPTGFRSRDKTTEMARRYAGHAGAARLLRVSTVERERSSAC